MESIVECDVVVIGAGISGLSAAWMLHKRDASLKVVVLEAKGRVGGRTETIKLKTGNGSMDFWDIGGQWVGSTQTHIIDVIKELGLATYKQFTDGTKLMQLGSYRVRSYKSEIPSFSLLGVLDLARFLHKVEQMRKTVDVFEPFECPEAKEWDKMTLDTFIQKTLWTEECKDSLIATSRTMLGCEPSQISLLFFLFYASAAGGLMPLIGNQEQSAQGMKVEGGTQQISQKMAKLVGEGAVLLNQPVVKVTQLADHVDVTTATNKLFRSKRVIFAVPPPQLGHIHFEPGLPYPKLNMIKRMPMGHLNKVIITYKHAFWKTAGLSGEAVMNGGPSPIAECSCGPLGIIMDATSVSGNPALVSFIASDQAVEWALQSADKRKSAVLKSLADLFGEDVFDCADYIEKEWSHEPYTMGAPIAIASPGTMAFLSEGLRKPFDKLHFAGTESATQWCGYMSGAVQAGYRAAMEVLYHVSPKAVTREDMVGTAYDQHKHKTRVIPRTKQPICPKFVKYTAIVAVVIGSLYITKRFKAGELLETLVKRFQNQ
ncbi:hypothetical protein ScPMuIL_004652 [Solemya velum]